MYVKTFVSGSHLLLAAGLKEVIVPYLRKYLAIFVALTFILIAVGCSSNQNAQDVSVADSQEQQTTTTEPFMTPVTTTAPYKNINAQQAEQLINNGGIQILDLRDTYLYSNKHILGADSLPYTYLTEQMTKLDKSKPVLVYDDQDKISKNAAMTLIQNGFPQVYNLAGGMVTWVGSVEPN
jgi:rhodanese-related sulfurtransferase